MSSIENRIKNYHTYSKQKLPYQTLDDQEDDLNIKGVRKTSQRINLMKWPLNFEGASVLDIGCNTGAFCFEAKRRGAGKVVGIDMAYSSINICRGLNQKLDSKLRPEFHVINLNLNNALIDLAFRTGGQKFDYLLVLSVWKHIYDFVFWKLIRNFTKRGCYLEMNAVFDSRHLSEDQRKFLNKNRQNVEVLKKYLLEKSGAKEVTFLGYNDDQGRRGSYYLKYSD